VGSDRSPALESRLLNERFQLTAGSIELTEVVRQQVDSGILKNATALRALLIDQKPAPRFEHLGRDVVRIDGTQLQEEMEQEYARQGDDEVCLITRSNKRAYQFSQQVRARIRGFEEELCAGDRLMVVRNDYFWAGRSGKADLIANGEQMEVLRVKNREERFGARFQWIDARWWSGSRQREGEVLLMLDVLALDTPALPFTQRRAINDAILATMEGRTQKEPAPEAQGGSLRQCPPGEIRLRRHLPQGPGRSVEDGLR
jgi:exodeoxyribonuclease-5